MKVLSLCGPAPAALLKYQLVLSVKDPAGLSFRYARSGLCCMLASLDVQSSDLKAAGMRVGGRTPYSGDQPLTHDSVLQVMPQLLNFLGVPADDKHALDWGTIAVYSCAASCKTSESYVDEHVVVQP